MSRTYGGLFSKDADPHVTILINVIRQAKVDAERGDLGALAWLITTGSQIAGSIAEDGECGVLAFCRECWENFDDRTRAKFRVKFEC